MNTTKIKVLGLLGLPLLAIAVAVMVFAVGSSTDRTEAANTGAEAMSLSVTAGSFDCSIVSKEPKDPNVPIACVPLGSSFTVSINADNVPAAGYVNAGAWVFYGDDLGARTKGTDHDSNDDDGSVTAEVAEWTDCAGLLYLTTNTNQVGPGSVSSTDPEKDSYSAGCITGTDPLPVSNYKGSLFTFDLTCTQAPSNQTLELLQSGEAPAGTSGALYVEADGTTQTIPAVTDLEVNCSPGPTATPTSTPPPIPKMQKCDAATIVRDQATSQKTTCDNLVNVFLTRQGAKVPPASCLGTKGTDHDNAANLVEQLSAGIVSPFPKDISQFQVLAAFEFEVHYDNKKVCVDLNEGQTWVDAGAICAVEDDQPDSKPQLEGVARIGCVTIGKDGLVDGLAALATVDIYPQPEIYSPMKPNQDNGNVVQINNVNCDLGDEQGHAIPIFSCDDADITFRYLEGDVEPDCVIDTVDAQAIAFRWGVEKGSLIYKDFMNLEPSSQQQDNDIDINDLQFVFGRFGSTCADPHPPQDPVNPKA